MMSFSSTRGNAGNRVGSVAVPPKTRSNGASPFNACAGPWRVRPSVVPSPAPPQLPRAPFTVPAGSGGVQSIGTFSVTVVISPIPAP